MFARYFPLAVFLLLVVITTLIATRFEAGEWYHVTMQQPSWMPRWWFFGMAWSVVHLCLAVAAWKVWLTAHDSRNGALTWWAMLLLLNVSWSAVFFGLNRPGWSWLLLCLTGAIAILCFRAFRRLSSGASEMLIPYLVWVLFIWALNLIIWTINGGPLQKLLSLG